MGLEALVGSGRKITLLAAPFLIVGLVLNVIRPSFFSVGGPRRLLKVLSVAMLIPGVVIWVWSAVLVLRKVPRQELITNGPYSLMKHPLYTSVSLLVLPSTGFLLDTWLGALLGAVVYGGSRAYSPEEERELSESHGAAWDEYSASVKLPWL